MKNRKANINKMPFNVFSKKGLMELALAGVMMVTPFMLAGCTGEQGPKGDAGVNGATWHSGTEYSASQGVVGDFFYDTDDFNIYQKTTDGWTLISNIKGPQGDTGATGPQGPAGQDGISAYVGYDGYVWNGTERTEFLVNANLEENVIENTIGIQGTMSKYFAGSYLDLSENTIALMANYMPNAKLTQYSGTTITKLKVVAEEAGNLYIGTAKVADVVNARTNGTSYESTTISYTVESGLNTITLELVVGEDETVVLGGQGSIGLYHAQGITINDEHGNFTLLDGTAHTEVISETSNTQDTLAIQISAEIKTVVAESTAIFDNVLTTLPTANISSSTAANGGNPYVYQDLTLFSNKTITKIGIPVKTVTDISGATFTVYKVKTSEIQNGGVDLSGSTCQKYDLNITSEQIGSSTTVNKWIYVDCEIEIGEDETLAFDSNDSMVWGFVNTTTASKLNFYSRITTTDYQFKAMSSQLCFDVYCSENTEQYSDFEVHLQGLYEKEYNAKLIKALRGKNVSLIGDSISTFEGYSNDGESTNSTIVNNGVYYGNPAKTTPEMTVEETWWMQVINNNEMNLLVNNSYTSSTVTTNSAGTNSAGHGIRAVNLHDDTGENAGTDPDVIFVYMGINDIQTGQTAGSFESLNVTTLITDNGDGSFTYATPANFAEAYLIMMHKMTQRYSSSDIFCFTLPYTTRTTTTTLETFNSIIKSVAILYGVEVIDLYNETCWNSENISTYANTDGLHPNMAGMDVITEVIENNLYEYYVTNVNN